MVCCQLVGGRCAVGLVDWNLSYVGSRVTSITDPSRFGLLRFSSVIVSFGITKRPSLCTVARKLSLTPNTPTMVIVAFKISVGSNLYFHRINLGTCRR